MKTLKEAQDLIFDQVRVCRTEKISLRDALGRVLDQVIQSDRSIPAHTNSAMDGYAFTFRGEEPQSFEVIGEIPAGATVPRQLLEPHQCWRIMTGGPLPPGADTVAPKEIVQVLDNGDKIRLSRPPQQGAHVRRAGEDIYKGENIDLRGRPLGPGDLGVLASLGATEVSVYRKPQVAVFGTGEKLVEPHETPQPGQVVNSNNWSLTAAIECVGAQAFTRGHARDQKKAIENKFLESQDCEVILSTGGVSVGDYDYVKEVLDSLGAKTLFWKVAIKPGKPLVFSHWGHRYCFGLPGNPVSCLVNFELFVAPLLRAMMGFKNIFPFSFPVTLKEDFPSTPGRTHCVRAILERNSQGQWEARLTGPQGSGILKSMSLANALILVDQPLPAGAQVQARWLFGREPWL